MLKAGSPPSVWWAPGGHDALSRDSFPRDGADRAERTSSLDERISGELKFTDIHELEFFTITSAVSPPAAGRSWQPFPGVNSEPARPAAPGGATDRAGGKPELPLGGMTQH